MISTRQKAFMWDDGSQTYDKNKIINTYYSILILDSCGDKYDEISKRHCPQDLIGACKRVIELIKTDKELGPDYGTWSYLVIKHEEDNVNDWQSFYKVYKYRKMWKYKRVEY